MLGSPLLMLTSISSHSPKEGVGDVASPGNIKLSISSPCPRSRVLVVMMLVCCCGRPKERPECCQGLSLLLSLHSLERVCTGRRVYSESPLLPRMCASHFAHVDEATSKRTPHWNELDNNTLSAGAWYWRTGWVRGSKKKYHHGQKGKRGGGVGQRGFRD